MRGYYATYKFAELDDSAVKLPVGLPVSEDEGYSDTLFVHVEIFREIEVDGVEPELVASTCVRRILISKIIDEGRSVYDSMDQIDQFEFNIFEAVWNDDEGHYRLEEAMCGDLLIFQHMHVEETSLPGFNVVSAQRTPSWRAPSLRDPRAIPREGVTRWRRRHRRGAGLTAREQLLARASAEDRGGGDRDEGVRAAPRALGRRAVPSEEAARGAAVRGRSGGRHRQRRSSRPCA